MIPDWKKLRPERALEPREEALYVQAPGRTAEHIADWIRVGGTTVVLTGPRGIGKTTELHLAAKALHQDRVAAVLPLSRFDRSHELTPDGLLLRVAGRAAFVALQHLKLSLDPEITEHLVDSEVLTPKFLSAPPGPGIRATPQTVLEMTLKELAEKSKQGRVTILIDGIDQLPMEKAAELAGALGRIPDDVDLVITIP